MGGERGEDKERERGGEREIEGRRNEDKREMTQVCLTSMIP